VYLPDFPLQAYADLLDALDQEFTYTFGGSTIIRGLDGSYLSQPGLRIRDRVNLIYTDTPFAFDDNFGLISRYADALLGAASEALQEESIMVVGLKVFHAE
jgi:hypothetical protein